MYLVDSHCHLDLIDVASEDHLLNSILMRAKELGVGHILNVCVSLKDFPNVLNIAQAYPNVSASVGLHPNQQDETVDEATLIKLGQHKKIVAIGETGLDYFRSQGDLTWQRDRFRAHIRAAKEIKKPLIIHTRQAKEDTLLIMREEGAAAVSGVMHCFTEDWATAQLALDLNFYISFSGIITFKNATVIQEVARRMPLERMLIETDAPYLAPNPYRGKQNEPGYVKYTAEFIANLRATSFEAIANATTQNFFNLFKGAEKYYV